MTGWVTETGEILTCKQYDHYIAARGLVPENELNYFDLLRRGWARFGTIDKTMYIEYSQKHFHQRSREAIITFSENKGYERIWENQKL